MEPTQQFIGVGAEANAGSWRNKTTKQDKICPRLRSKQIGNWHTVGDDLKWSSCQKPRHFVRGRASVEKNSLFVINNFCSFSGDRSFCFPVCWLLLIKFRNAGESTCVQHTTMSATSCSLFLERIKIPTDCRLGYTEFAHQFIEGCKPPKTDDVD